MVFMRDLSLGSVIYGKELCYYYKFNYVILSMNIFYFSNIMAKLT